jgi:SAM-dependent methyltransferase
MKEKNPFLYHADKYFLHRPTYPQEGYHLVAELCEERQLALDCATGNGQAALGLADYFGKVIAIDSSEEQIANAFRLDNVTYMVAPAENIPLPDNSVDLITVAQGVHWFYLDNFYSEAERLLKKGGVIALWCYNEAEITPEIDKVLRRLAFEILMSYWEEPVIKYVFNNYENLPFPFEEIKGPSFFIKREWHLEDALNYIRTWSAIARYREEKGADPVDEILPQLRDAWGDPKEYHLVQWPIHYRIGKKK